VKFIGGYVAVKCLVGKCDFEKSLGVMCTMCVYGKIILERASKKVESEWNLINAVDAYTAQRS
jgi:hypothetical protein